MSVAESDKQHQAPPGSKINHYYNNRKGVLFMGFRCPRCKRDFGLNHEEFSKHLLQSPQCALLSSLLISAINEAVKPDEDN